jgi:hypothetical protein
MGLKMSNFKFGIQLAKNAFGPSLRHIIGTLMGVLLYMISVIGKAFSKSNSKLKLLFPIRRLKSLKISSSLAINLI